ncbi:DUF4124 domain-containing protein [Luteimonas suaedae]|uniref:DUF4124 domain-containing protein n=1 Tax=Luteimonas suaedae TaxID=2605430 RepID=UPI0011EDDA3E|nr:DUF4124 domain-containing protein [Luteimonas suaedae]
MRHPILGTALALVAAAFATGAGASEVYQWKDASGVTHYSESPPPSGNYQQRKISDSGASTSQTTSNGQASANPAAAENPQCAIARRNIETLRGEGPVQQDDGEGNVRELDADERANQLELAQAAVRAYCTDDAPAA